MNAAARVCSHDRSNCGWTMRGCSGWIVTLLIIGVIGSYLAKCSGGSGADHDKGPIPKRFQGAYNSIGCANSADHIDGLVTVGADSINYGGATFEPKEVASESKESVTLRGDPIAGGGRESSRTFTMTFAKVGEMATLDGDSYQRCSEY